MGAATLAKDGSDETSKRITAAILTGVILLSLTIISPKFRIKFLVSTNNFLDP